MIASVLSYFDVQKGPQVLISTHGIPEHIRLEHIAFLIDFYEKGFFIHDFGELRTANLIFTIYSPLTRGNEEILMISIVILDEQYNLNSFQEKLNKFVKEFKKISDAYKSFHPKSKDIPDSSEKLEEIKNFFILFFQTLHKDSAKFEIKTF